MSCDCPPPGPPTLAGFTAFVFGEMGVPASALSSTDPIIATAYCVAIAIVNQALIIIPLLYQRAVYNLAASNLLNFASDGGGSDPNSTFFADIRSKYNMTSFTAGVVSGAADVSTSVTILNPDFMQGLTMANLQQLKDPYGRAYLAIAQDYGPASWGLS